MFAMPHRAVLLALLLGLGACDMTFRPEPSEAPLNLAHWHAASDWEDAMARQEAQFLKAPEARAQRGADGALRLTLADGRAVTIAEDRACQGARQDVLRDCVRKYAIYRFAGRGYWLLAVKLKEGEAYSLVDAKAGIETLLIGQPRFSPGGQFVAAVNRSQRGDTVNGLEVWRRDAEGLTLVYFHEEAGQAGYEFVDWFSDDTARLVYRGCADPAAPCDLPREAVLTGRGGKWRVAPLGR